MKLLEIEKELSSNVVKTCYDLEVVNRLVKECPEKLVKISEKIVDEQIDKVVKCVMKGNYKFLFLSGPSSSGKTTTANFIIKKLQKKGKRAIRVSLDDFFIDLDKCPVQEDGTVDKEDVSFRWVSYVYKVYKYSDAERTKDKRYVKSFVFDYIMNLA